MNLLERTRCFFCFYDWQYCGVFHQTDGPDGPWPDELPVRIKLWLCQKCCKERAEFFFREEAETARTT